MTSSMVLPEPGNRHGQRKNIHTSPSSALTMATAAVPLLSRESFEDVTAIHRIHVAPRFLGNLMEGIKAHLDASLLRYSPKLGGIPLCYSKVKVVSNLNEVDDSNAAANDGATTPSAPIIYDNPCVHVCIRVHWALFSPVAGRTILPGTINAISPEHIGLLVLGYFSAIIPAVHLEASYVWDSDLQTWSARRKPYASLALEGHVEFVVLQLQQDGPVLTLIGSIDRLLDETVPVAGSVHDSSASLLSSASTMPAKASPARSSRKRSRAPL